MNFIYEIFPERFITAFGWTILHSLWQGLIAGLLLMVILYLYRNHSPVIRYNISLISLFFIFFLCVRTFLINYFGNSNSDSALLSESLANKDFDFKDLPYADKTLPSMLFDGRVGYVLVPVSDWFPLIISLWILGVTIITIRASGGLFLIRKIKKSSLFLLPSDIEKQIHDLTIRMNVKTRLQIFESYLVKSPVVIGYFKPMILLPFSVVTQIPYNQLEAIIAHELAHILRHDYLINIFQSVIEILLFYHPAIWFINRQIRREREHCCDDTALLYSDAVVTYAKALTRIHEISFRGKFPVLAISSKKYNLLSRVIRILNSGKMKTSLTEKLLAGFLVISATTIFLLNTGAASIHFNSTQKNSIINIKNPDITSQEINPYVPSEPVIKPKQVKNPSLLERKMNPSPDVNFINRPDTTLKVEDNIVYRTFVKDGKEMNLKMKIEKGEVKELYVNGIIIPEDQYNEYQTEIDKTIEELNEIYDSLAKARVEMEEIDLKKLQIDVQKEIENINLEEIKKEMESIKIPEINEEEIRIEMEKAIAEIEAIDTEKIRHEIDSTMKMACEMIKEIKLPDCEDIRMEIEMALKEIQEIDPEQIRKEIEESMQDVKENNEKIREEMRRSLDEIEKINMEEIKIEMEKALKDVEVSKSELELEKQKMDDMLKEIEKLELDKR